jgi:hypothetical protein
MSSLFDLTAELRHLEALVSSMSPDGELPEDVVRWLDDTEGNYAQKVEGYCGVIGELEALAKAREEEASRVRELARLTAMQVERMREALKQSLLKLDRPKVETLRYKVWVQAAGGKQPMAVNECFVPHDWKRVELVTDKERIRTALEGGQALDFAELLPRGHTLRIK